MSKIAVPSNNKVTIAEEFDTSEFFIIFTVGDGFVKNEELRENPYAKSKSSDIDKSIKFDNLFNFLCDCQIIICKNIDKSLSEKFKQVGIKIYKTLEDSARKGIINTICR